MSADPLRAPAPAPIDGTRVEQCCARLYESEAATWLLGDSFHPGGLQLTERLGRLLRLKPGSRVLDVAAGRGTSAMHLAEHFGCEVVGIDYGEQNVREATRAASGRGLSERVEFQRADAQALPFPAASFDALLCECAFCTFPDKPGAGREFARVLRPGGRVGLSDLTRSGTLPESLSGLLAWISCIADAQPIEAYQQHLRVAGLTIEALEIHDGALRELAREVQGRLLATEILSGLKKLTLPAFDFPAARQLARAALAAVDSHQLGYALISAVK